MCILFIAVKQHPQYPLIIAANRDEFHQRPTAPSHFWPTHPQMLAGKDLQAGGSWMGITRAGRLSALTNVRDPQTINPDAISRGELVTQYLSTEVEQAQYLTTLRAHKAAYNGYNLLFGEWQNLWVYNNHSDTVAQLTPGVYGLSNADLNSPWPKINQGVKQLKQHCQQTGPIHPDTLFDILLNQNQASDDLLPETGIPIEWERKLSSIFITSSDYGTRSATLLLVDRSHQVIWLEHSFNPAGENTQQQRFTFSLN
ncbi:NRDE family protein [Aliiglaciecola sp. LCG003]|uniref:NRDE family protein n=1 Tax=Aliiglaciecola sp. LCG003 TaxID=3053655 RepID=UPI0025727762|nr:NRDE family protein [Aliiglaciecola sp. LCG003]WJG07781.1 NRDE family protein [Aliiglaciecola sp. LCG003]